MTGIQGVSPFSDPAGYAPVTAIEPTASPAERESDESAGAATVAAVAAEREERTHWSSLIAEGSVERLALAVLERLRLDGNERLLAMAEDHRRFVERSLRASARLRLNRQAVRPRTYDRALGHPVRLAELAYEDAGETATAAAMYALSHDQLHAERRLEPDLEWLALRFALARALASIALDDVSPAACSALVEDARERLEAMADTRAGRDERHRLRQAMDAWLAERHG